MTGPMRGLIPAHAGKTVAAWLACGAYAAHPRSRGENTASFFGSADTLGSSPLTRGKHHDVRREVLVIRLIPAHAGKTRPRFSGRRTPWAHPRSRGENSVHSRPFHAWMGSSPLTRGKRPPRDADPGGPGLIPAHAGKTPAPRTQLRSSAAHPRSRGENPRWSGIDFPA